MLFTLLHKAFKLCSNFERFHQEIDKLKTVFENYGYPKSFVDFYIKKYLDKVFIKKKVVLKASKKELICVFLFLGKKSMQLRTRLVNSIESNLKFWKLKVNFQSPCKLNPLFRLDLYLITSEWNDLGYPDVWLKFFASGLIIFFINGNPVFSNGSSNLPRNPPDCIIFNNWAFDSLISTDK